MARVRPHRKSRHGCQQCKARKIKCDETKPECRKCARRGKHCSYRVLQLANDVSSHSHSLSCPITSAPETSVVFRGYQALLPFPPQNCISMLVLDTANLQLLHHFSTSTSYTLAQDPVLQAQWRVKAPECGFTTEFILRAILALSALHLAYINPEKREQYISQADHHHEIALQTVNRRFTRLIQENRAVIHLFSVLTCFIACAKPVKSDNFLITEGKMIPAWITIIRGLKSIAYFDVDILKTGPLAPMFSRGEQMAQRREKHLHDKIACVEDLRRFVIAEVTNQRELDIYLRTLDEFNKSLAMMFDMGPVNCEIGDVFIWMFRVPDEFFAFLSQHKPVGLIIYSYFAVLLLRLEWAWWIQGWASHIISGIYKLLDDRYRPWMQWPMEQIGPSTSTGSGTSALSLFRHVQ